MPPGILNESNPLTKYKRKNPYVQWEEISEKSGLSKGTLIRVAKLDIEGVRRMSIDSLMKIKKAIDVDLYDESIWRENNEQNQIVS